MRSYLTAALCLFAFGCCEAYAEQARRYVLLEHFTQAGCGPCASFNPGFEKDILRRNPGSVHHIAYHTSWPGSDPMYDYNPSANNARTEYYGIFAVPQVIILGDNTAADTFEGSQELIDSIAAAGSPLAVIATESESNGVRTVEVRLTSVGDPPAGEYRLQVAVVERLVEYPTPPGSNGERSFPNVLRTMLPSAQGTAVALPAAGQSATYSFPYSLDAKWNADEIYVIAFVQNTKTLEVINSGSTLDLKANLTASAHCQASSGSSPIVFNLTASNTQNYDRPFRVRLTSNAPAGWNADLLADGQPIGDGVFSIGGQQARALELSVAPSDEAAVGAYTVELVSADEPELVASVQKMYVSHRVTNLVVSNDGRWNAAYSSPLASVDAGVGVIDAEGFGKAEDVWADVHSIYYNAGWTFPALTNSGVQALRRFIDKGGNLLIAGQDIGWDQSGGGTKIISDDFIGIAPGGTPTTRWFVQEYLQTGFYDDGVGMKSVVAVHDDAVYGSISPSQLTDVHSFLAPDVLVPVGNAVPVYMYGEDKDNIAGQRGTRGSSKIVYFGFGLEMLGSDAVRNDILAATYKWFEGKTSDVEYDMALQSAGTMFFPNPANDWLTVVVPVHSRALRLLVFDVHGAEVAGSNIPTGSASVQLSTRSLPSGAYTFRIVGDGAMVHSGTFQIVH